MGGGAGGRGKIPPFPSFFDSPPLYGKWLFASARIAGLRCRAPIVASRNAHPCCSRRQSARRVRVIRDRLPLAAHFPELDLHRGARRFTAARHLLESGIHSRPGPSPMALLEIRNVTRRFGDFTAVDNVSIRIEGGEFFTLLGPSGRGEPKPLRE